MEFSGEKVRERERERERERDLDIATRRRPADDVFDFFCSCRYNICVIDIYMTHVERF